MFDCIPTLADVCNAIAEGNISATSDGLSYHVNASELRRFLNKFRSLPSISDVHLLPSSSDRDTDDWPVSARTSIA